MTSKRWRVLMFAPAFAPQGNSEAIVNGKLGLAMLNSGWDVRVISRVPNWETAYDYGAAWSEPWLPLKQRVHEITVARWSMPRRGLDLVLSAIRMHYPIDGLRWASRAHRVALRLHAERPFDVVMSRALPDVAHLPAMKLARQFRVPWVANWNDPWDFLGAAAGSQNLSSAIGLIEAAMCRRVAARASWVTFPCEGLRAALASALGVGEFQGSSVVPHAALGKRGPKMHQPPGTFTVTHVGKIWVERGPEEIFAAFRQLLQEPGARDVCKLCFAGLSDVDLEALARRFGLGPAFVRIGPCTFLESLKLMNESAVLLLVDSVGFSDLVLAGKAADYASSGRAILAITSANSAISRMIRDRGGGLVVVSRSANAVANALGELFRCWRNGSLQLEYGSDRLYNTFSPDAIIPAYEAIFEHLSQPH